MLTVMMASRSHRHALFAASALLLAIGLIAL